MRLMIVGFGVVGRSTIKVLTEQKESLRKRYGLNPKIVAIVDINGALVNSRGISNEEAIKAVKLGCNKFSRFGNLWRPDVGVDDLLPEIECEAMIETTPTNLKTGQPGLNHLRSAMKNGVHVVTTNKGPLALAMPALVELAEHNRISFKFSGTVGGGTPMLDLAKKSMDGLEIQSIRGILNGTTNFILSKMDAEGISFDSALREARKKGYAETDPTYDIDALDPAAKLVILANWVMGKSLSIKDVSITGIRGVSQRQINEAKAGGKTMKLIAYCGADAIEVAPSPIPREHPLNVSGTTNALTFNTDLAGEITIVGKGAGGPETASAVLRDLIDIRKTYAKQAARASAAWPRRT